MHEGHRQRLLGKLDNEPYDHELIEALLFFSMSRIDTNGLAHTLLDKFGSVKGVIFADEKELLSVKGIGKHSVNLLKTVRVCFKRATSLEEITVLKNFEDCKNFISMRLYGLREENLELYFLDKNSLIRRIINYTSSDKNKVIATTDDISAKVAAHKPYAIVAAHNHTNGYCSPSDDDDRFTRALQLICSINGVRFSDHIIYSEGNSDEYYSYRNSGKLDNIREEMSLEKVCNGKRF